MAITMTLRLLTAMAVLVMSAACTSKLPDYDAEATETYGKVVSKSVIGTFNRSVETM